MGKEISRIAYNEDYVDLGVIGLSPIQVGLIKEHFLAVAGKTKAGEPRVGARHIAGLVGVPAKEAQLIVDFADLDGDGCLSDYEFTCLVGLFTQGSMQDKLIALFSLFDSDLSQLISLEEMTQLVRCVLGINEQGREPGEAQVREKIADIQALLFSDEPQIRLADFVVFAQEDDDFRTALRAAGVLSEKECRADFNKDLEDELHRLDDDALRGDEEEFTRKRLGVRSGEDDGPFESEEVGEGDQFMAVKPFLGVVRNSVPSAFDPARTNLSIPNASLELEHVHGFRCFDTRNNLRWVDGNNFLFHSAAVAVSMNCETGRQKFNLSNTDDIIAFDKHRNLAATGQIGHKPVINLWDCATMESLALIRGQLEKGISHVCFSADGKLLAGCAMNDDHDIAVYDVAQPAAPKLLAHAKGVKDVVLDMRFLVGPGTPSIALATQKGLYVVEVGRGSLKVGKASGWGSKGPQACLCIGFVKSADFVVGLQSGELASVKGRSLAKTYPAHKGPLFAVCNDSAGQRLFTGGADGLVIVWDAAFAKVKTIEIGKENLGIISPKVRALSFEENTNRLLVGARSGEVFELAVGQPGRGRVHLRGHFDHELWGLSVHPTGEEYVTCGEDFLLAKWSVASKKQLANIQLKFQAKTTDICPKGRSLAVGCTNGTVLVFDYAGFRETKALKPSAKEISIVRFSPESAFLAAGCHDAAIYIFNASKGFIKQAVCKGHHSTITHLDFSKNGATLMSNCTSYEILFWGTESGKQDTRGASANRDEEWASWTCTLGWPVQGVFPPFADGTDVNSVDRHKSGALLASGDDFGKVNLFRFPCLKDAAFMKFVGHSSHVTGVKFTASGRHLISVGGNDKSIFQWRLDLAGAEEEPAFEDAEIDATEFVPRSLAADPEPSRKHAQGQGDGLFEELEDEAGDQFMAVKPFVGDLKKSIPSDFVYVRGMEDAPQENLALYYVNGYRCFDARNTARFGKTKNQVVFASAALGVELNVEQNTQTFFNAHEEDIISFDMHPGREIVATGQMAMKGKAKLIDIFVWQVADKRVLANLKGFHIRAIQLLRFSPGGSKLLTFGQDDDNSLAVYDWANGVLLATSKVDKTNVLECVFTTEAQFLTSGTKHLKVWNLTGTNVTGKNVSWSALKNKSEPVVALAALEGGLAVGGSWSGSLLTISGGGISTALKAHEGPVYVLHYARHVKKLYSGGKDGAIHEFAAEGGRLKLLRTVFKLPPSESLCPSIRVIDTLGETMLVGTMASELFSVENFISGAGGRRQLLLTGHFKGELWGLACHPALPQYATCGDDETVRTWSVATRRMLACQHTKLKLRALDFSPDGKHIVTASMCGKVLLFDGELKRELQNFQSAFKSANQWIEEIKFAPNGGYVAFGAHGGASKLEVLAFDGKSLRPFASVNCGLTSALLHLDWSEQSDRVVVNSQAYELKFADVLGKRQISASDARETTWATWTCKLGFPVQGIFPGVDGTDVNTVCRAASRKVLATGDDFQLVKLFKCPSVQPKSGFKSYVAHASHVTRVRFMLKDSFMVSTGGNDKVNIIWTTDFGADTSVPLASSGRLFKAPSGAAGGEEDEEDLVVHRKTKKDKYGKSDPPAGEEFGEVAEGGDRGLFEEECVEEGTEFMAVKPWLGAIKSPSNFVSGANPDLAPNVDISLEYAHGYRSKDCRNNLFWVDDALFYHTAALGVRLDYAANTQTFFGGHRDDIISMAYSKARNMFATAEIGPKPRVFLWSADSLAEVSLLKGGAIKGVCALAFSPSGARLAGACIDDNHHVVLYDTVNFSLLACEKGDTASILDCAWVSEGEFVTVGLRHFKLWQASAGLKASRGSFGQNNDKLVCCAKFKSSVLCGTVAGELQVWNGAACGKSLKIHQGTLDAIFVTATDKIITGGKDKRLNILDSNLVFLAAINLNEILTEGVLNEVRAISLSSSETELFIGTFASEIYRLTATDGGKLAGKLDKTQLVADRLMSGHFAKNAKWTNEVWALAALRDDRFLTASDDGTLRLWSRSERRMLKLLKLNIDAKGCQLELDKATGDLAEAAKLRAVGVCQEDKHAAVGCKEGTLRIIDLAAWKQIHLIKKRKEWISETRYSPNNEFLAVGSHDNVIDIYAVHQKYKLLHSMKKHSSFITHLDWSVDSSYLHSNCGAYELLFWDANSGKQLTAGASALKDEQWSTWSCVLGWPVQGIFQPEWDGSDVNMVDRSNRETRDGCKLLATGDDFSTIRVYKYPCLRKTAKAVILYGHSSHVTNVKFDPNDEYIYSTGGEDHSVMQWKVTLK